LFFDSFKVQSKQGKVKVCEIEEKLERIESIERKLEVLYARFDTLERLSSRERPNSSESEALESSQGHQENSQKREVYILKGF
jgi:hypothetical protein